MTEMTKEQMVEKIQESEMVAWNDYRRAVEAQGDGSTIAYAMKHRHAAIHDLMEEMGILCVDKVNRILAN